MDVLSVDKEKDRILNFMGYRGDGYANDLAQEYMENAETRAAISDLMFEKVGSFARQMMVRVVGKAGDLQDAVYLSLLLDSSQKPKFDYPFKEVIEYAKNAYFADSDWKVREAAVEAIGNILSRIPIEMKGYSPAGEELGRTLVKCALLDPSERARCKAAELVWNYGDENAISSLLLTLSKSELGADVAIFSRAEVAVLKAIEAMKAKRVRGTALHALVNEAVKEGKAGRITSDVVVELCRHDEGALGWLKLERAKVERGENGALGEEEREEKCRRIKELIVRVGAVGSYEKKEIPRTFREMEREKDSTRKGKNLKPAAEEDEIVIPRGPVVEFFRRLRDRVKGRKG